MGGIVAPSAIHTLPFAFESKGKYTAKGGGMGIINT